MRRRFGEARSLQPISNRVISSGYVVSVSCTRARIAHVSVSRTHVGGSLVYAQRFLRAVGRARETKERLDMKGSNRKSGSRGVFRSLRLPAREREREKGTAYPLFTGDSTTIVSWHRRNRQQ